MTNGWSRRPVISIGCTVGPALVRAKPTGAITIGMDRYTVRPDATAPTQTDPAQRAAPSSWTIIFEALPDATPTGPILPQLFECVHHATLYNCIQDLRPIKFMDVIDVI